MPCMNQPPRDKSWTKMIDEAQRREDRDSEPRVIPMIAGDRRRPRQNVKLVELPDLVA
jgi:hypothetical protein